MRIKLIWTIALLDSGENTALRAQVAQLLSTNQQMVSQLARLSERLDEMLAAARRKGRKGTAEKKTLPAPVVAAEAQQAFEARPIPPVLPEKPKALAGKRRPSGRKPLPDHLPVDEHRFRPDVCEHCGGGKLDVVDEVVEEKLDVVKEHQRRRRVVRVTCRCRDCFERTTPASLPAPYARSKVTCDWLAWFIHQKFGLLAPLDRIRRDLAERKIPLAMGTLVNFVERAADLLAPIDGVHWQKLLAGPWMATDGTGLKVLIPGLPEAHNGYIELYRNDELSVFQ
jgi:transposase